MFLSRKSIAATDNCYADDFKFSNSADFGARFFHTYSDPFGYVVALVLENLLSNGMLRQRANLLRTFLDGECFSLLIAWSRNGMRLVHDRRNIFIEVDSLPILFLMFPSR